MTEPLLVAVPNLGLVVVDAIDGHTIIVRTAKRHYQNEIAAGASESIRINKVDYTFHASAHSKAWFEKNQFSAINVAWTVNREWGVSAYDLTGGRVNDSGVGMTTSAMTKIVSRVALFVDGFVETPAGKRLVHDAADEFRNQMIADCRKEIVRLRQLLNTQETRLGTLLGVEVADLLALRNALVAGETIDTDNVFPNKED